jgi:hypothetical protein
MSTRLNRDVSDRIDDGARLASSSVAPSSVAMPTGTPPWMWLARESLPHLPRILQAVARIVLALLLGGAALVLALKGRSVPGELLRMIR